jgi:arginase family enzyme
VWVLAIALLAIGSTSSAQQGYTDGAGTLRVALARQPLSPNGPSKGQLDRLDRITDKIYVHIDMDVLDPREVMAHGNKVPGGPSSEELARLFEAIFTRYRKASAIGFATIPPTDEGGLSIAALNRMIAAAARGVAARK